MLRFAGQTAGPIKLKFFWGHSMKDGGGYRLKKSNFFFKIYFPIFLLASPGPSVSFTYKQK